MTLVRCGLTSTLELTVQPKKGRSTSREARLSGLIRQKEQLCLERHGARGCERVTVHALLCMIAMLFNALAALKLNKQEKARSITMLAR